MTVKLLTLILSISENDTVVQTVGKIKYCGFSTITNTKISHPTEVTF